MNIVELTVSLIRGEITNTNDNLQLTQLSVDDLKKLYVVSQKHDVAQIVASALKKRNLLGDDEASKLFLKSLNLALYRYERLQYDLQEIKRVLNENEIKFIPLKGSVIRNYYPQPWMRTSCDIDVLISQNDVDKASEIFTEKLNFKKGEEWSTEVAFATESGMSVELHTSLKRDCVADGSSEILDNVWNYAAPVNGGYEYALSDDVLYYYHSAHMAKHFISGGCGIKPFIDLWVLNNKKEFDDEKRTALLKKGGLLQFVTAARNLSDVWFNCGKRNELTDDLEKYIISGGVYGSQKNMAKVGQSIKGGKFSYVMSRAFLPYDKLVVLYPKLEKRKWLFLYYQVKRWFKMLVSGRAKRSISEVKAINQVTESEKQSAGELLNKLGLK